MSKNNRESVQERIERMKQQREASGAGNNELVSQIAHESNGEPDFKDLAQRLQARHDEVKEATPKKEEEKTTLYIDKSVYDAFRALCINRGDQKRYINEAIQDFVLKKARELDV